MKTNSCTLRHHALFALAAVVFLALATVATAQTLFVSNPNSGTIFKITPDGTVTTFASGLSYPEGLAFDGSGNLYVANNSSGTISKITPDGTVTAFVFGTGIPIGLAFDGSGNLYADSNSGKISKITPGGTVTTFVSGLPNPYGLAFDSSGNLYAAEYTNGTISKITPGGTVTTFASGLGISKGLAFDGSGNLYVACSSTISKITPGGTVTTFASGLSNPQGLAFDGSGNLYAANYGNGTISKITADGTVTAFASGLNNPAFIAIQPQSGAIGSISGTVTNGASSSIQGATVSVVVSGTTYSTTSATNGTYTITGVPVGMGYTVTASMAGYANGTATGVNVTAGNTTTGVNITLSSAPTITIQPAGQIVMAGSNTSFTTAASGNPAPTYQWQVSTNSGSTWTNLTEMAPYSGTATGTLTITCATAAMNGCQYQCLASNSIQSNVASNAATLTVAIPSAATPFPLGTSGPGVQVGISAAFDGTNYLVGFQENPSSQGDYVGAELFSGAGTAVVPYLSTGTMGGFGAVAFDGTNYLMIWGDDGDNDAPISGCFINKSGVIIGVPFQISDHGGNGNYWLVYGGGQYLVCWSPRNGTTANGRLVPASLAQSGTLSTSSFAVNPSGSTAVPVGMGAAFDGTNFLVAWESQLSATSYDIEGRFMTPSGSMGTPFVISQTTCASKTDGVSIAYDGSRDYLVLWDSDAGSSIYARTVAKDGTFPSGEFAVAAGSGNNLYPGAASDGTNFLVTWANYPADGGSNVYAQFFSPTGQRQGAAIAPFTANGNNQPELAAPLFDGIRFLIVGFVGTSDELGDYFATGSTYATFLAASGSMPSITTQPVSQTVTAGQNATFAVAAGGTPAPGYQWQVSLDSGGTWSNLSDNGTYGGSATATLTVSGTTTTMSGDQFRCVVSNGMGPNATSNAATLTVLTPFQQWQLSNFGSTTAANAQPTATPANDGVSNLLKYAFNFPNPMVSNRSGLPVLGTTTSGGHQYLTITYATQPLAGDLTYSVQASTDMVNWTAITPAAPATTSPVTVTDTTPLSPGIRRFLRVVVVGP